VYFLPKIILFTASKSQKGELFRDFTEGGPNLSLYRVRTILFRTLPFPVRIFITLAVSFREAYPIFCPKMLRFFAKKVKSANRMVFKIKTILSF
jgi:hypothetical protein